MKWFYLALAWLFIAGEYVMRSRAWLRSLKAKPVGKHAGGRHRVTLVAAELAYVPVRVDGCASHRRRQGMLTLDAYRDRVAA